MNIPVGIEEALSKSTPEKVKLFDMALNAFSSLGFNVYCTNSPDIRIKHPINNIVFVTLWFQVQKGPRFEIRIDSCPRIFYENSEVDPDKIKQYDSGSSARWAVYPIQDQYDINAAIELINKVKDFDPSWG